MNNSSENDALQRMPWSVLWMISRLALFGTLSITSAIFQLQYNRIRLDVIVGVYSLLVACKLYDRRAGVIEEAYGWFRFLFWCDIVILGLVLFRVFGAAPTILIHGSLVAVGDAAFCWWALYALKRPSVQAALLQPPPRKVQVTLVGILLATLIVAANVNLYRSDLRAKPFTNSSISSSYSCSKYDVEWMTLRRRMSWGYKDQHFLKVQTLGAGSTPWSVGKFGMPAIDRQEVEKHLLNETSSVLLLIDGQPEWLDIDVERPEIEAYLSKVAKEESMPSAAGLKAYTEARP